MASPSKEKSPCLGVRAGLVPLYLCKGAPSFDLVNFNPVCLSFWFVLGNSFRQLLRVDTLVGPLSVAPAGYEPKLGSLRFVFRL